MHHQQRTGTQPGWGMFMDVGISKKLVNGLCVWWGGVGELALPGGGMVLPEPSGSCWKHGWAGLWAPSPTGPGGPEPSLPSHCAWVSCVSFLG